MLNDFFTRIFDHKTFGIDINVATLLEFPAVDIARLYLYFLASLSKNNQILLPEQFIHPELDIFVLSKDQKLSLSSLISKLSEFNYLRVDRVYDQMQYSVKGDVVTIFTNIADLVYRIEFFDNVIEKIVLIDPVNLRLIKLLDNAIVLNINPDKSSFIPEVIGDYKQFSIKPFIFTQNKIELHGFSRPNNYDALDLSYLPLFHRNGQVFNRFLRDYPDFCIYYVGHLYENLPESFIRNDLGINIQHLELPFTLEKGFIEKNSRTIVMTDYEALSTLNLKPFKQSKYSKFSKFFDHEININDYVVHESHGIGIYKGIETKVVLGTSNDYVVIEYLDGDNLLVPLSQLSRVSKYVSVEGHIPKLTKLGTAEWDSIRKKLKKNVEEIAKELLEIYAKKSIEKGIEFEKDNDLQEKFESECEFQLTEDQIKTLNEVESDMESPKPMDRLIIGDVGFGKTEIALRAALKAVLSKKQVMVLAPTTVLVSQLYNVFSQRLKNYPVRVARVLRFDGVKANKENLRLAKEGKIDILIGTHRLLSKDVVVPNLGLLIIDEEQRFGVRQKEKIRKLRASLDVLSMSATPIPRTLQMALTGIKDISIIATPPKGRLPVHNEVIFKDEIPEKIKFELDRGGQVFVVHNRIDDIDTFANEIIQQLPPGTKVCIGHGQMISDKLEKIMLDFMNKKYDVLIATTIIENGLDIPSVNTIIIDEAHKFGLAQLYQLRGRVGRGSTQAYCYLVLPKTKEFIKLHKNPTKELLQLKNLLDEHKIEDEWVTPDAVSRIEAILQNQELGAGFKIASRDLEIRGSGNLLGSEQSGHINAVGYELYIRLLEQEIDKIRTNKLVK